RATPSAAGTSKSQRARASWQHPRARAQHRSLSVAERRALVRQEVHQVLFGAVVVIGRVRDGVVDVRAAEEIVLLGVVQAEEVTELVREDEAELPCVAE